MTFNDYQKEAHKFSLNTQIDGEGYLYPLLGLSDEVGEVMGKVKKLYRDGDGQMTNYHKFEVAKEIGDVLWYLSELTEQLGFSLDFIAKTNLRKLKDREERGVIQGSGDDR